MIKRHKKSLFIAIQAAVLLVVSFTASGYISNEKKEPVADQYQGHIASLVGRYLEQFHYQQYEINDTLSQRLLSTYLEDLDPNKMFFLESDIESFQKYAKQLDDDLRAYPSRLDVPLSIYEVFRKRALERVKVINKLIETDMDFSKDEFISYDRREAPYAKTGKELDDLWRRRIKADMLYYELLKKPRDEYLDTLRKRYERLEQNVKEQEKVDIVETYLSSLATCFDPHSLYFKPMAKENFDIRMGHSLEGIGATLGREGAYTKVVNIIEGGPAHRSGKLVVGDLISAVAQGEDGEPEDILEMRIDKVVKKIRGPKGSKVRLTVIPAESKDHSKTKEVVLVRDRVELTQADARAEIHEVKGDNGETQRIGVIEIPSFYQDTRARYKGERNFKSTTRDVRKLIADMQDNGGIDGLLIDLRTNGGGSLDEAIQLSGLFIDYGPVVQVKGFNGKVDVEIDPDPDQLYTGPLLVLTSVFSASASEIFASAIQDYERGVVVGSQHTHGKGTVQNITGLNSRLSREVGIEFDEPIAGALKLTTHKFYRVNGDSTQAKGVEPHVVPPSPYDGLKVREDSLDQALPWDDIDRVAHKDYDLVDDSLDQIRKKSAERIETNPEFSYIVADNREVVKEREENRVSLNLEKRKAEQASDEKQEKARDEERKLRSRITKVIAEYRTKDSEPKEEPKAEAKEEKTEVADANSETKNEKVVIPDFVLEESLLVARDYISFRKNRMASYRH